MSLSQNGRRYIVHVDIDPQELGREYARLKRRLPQLNVFGGCCGTDQRHLEHIAAACVPLFLAAL